MSIPVQSRVQPISYAKIVDGQGVATDFFATQWQRLNKIVLAVVETQNELAAAQQQIGGIESTSIITSGGLTGGGPIGGGDITISAVATDILDQISSVHGSILFRGSAGWQALPPGNADYVLATKGASADPEWVAQTGGGGGGGGAPWEVITSGALSGAGPIDFTDLGDYSELLLYTISSTRSSAVSDDVRLSTNNGASFFSGATNYQETGTNGAITNANHISIMGVGSTFARSGFVHIFGSNVAGVAKHIKTMASGGVVFVGSTDPINAIRLYLSGASSWTGGTYVLLGRPA